MRILTVALAGLVLAGCTSTPEAETAPPTSAPATDSPVNPSPAPQSPATGESPANTPVPEILKFTATTVDGKSFEGASVAGAPVVFWFWAAWCPKCKEDAAAVRDLADHVKGRVSIVGVAGLGSGEPGMKDFVSDYGLTGFPQLADDTGAVWKRFRVPSQHYYVMLDASGKEINRGPLDLERLAETLG